MSPWVGEVDGGLGGGEEVADTGDPSVASAGDWTSVDEDRFGYTRKLLIPINVEADKPAEGGVGAEVGEDSLKLSDALFAVEVAKAEAAIPLGGIGDGSREVAVES